MEVAAAEAVVDWAGLGCLAQMVPEGPQAGASWVS